MDWLAVRLSVVAFFEMACSMRQEFVPPDATIAGLKKKAADCEQQAAEAEEPLATELRQEAKRYREWIKVLRTGRWTS